MLLSAEHVESANVYGVKVPVVPHLNEADMHVDTYVGIICTHIITTFMSLYAIGCRNGIRCKQK